MKKHFAKLLLLGAMIVAGFSFVGCNDIEKELADLNNKVENLESESAKNLQDAINALNAKLASDYALKTDVSALEIALKGTIAEQVAVAEAKINKAIEDAIAACKAESADAIAKVSADLAKVSEELTAVAGDVKAATAKIDENAAAIAGVDAKVLELKGTIDALADYLDTLEGMARENKATLDSFAEYFAEYKGDVDMKLTELHGSLGALSVYLEELEASIDARFAEHQNTFLALSAFLEEHEIEVDAKFMEILGTFDALAAHLEEREAKIDFALEEINGTFAALSPVIETMQAQILENHKTLEALADYLEKADYQGQIDSLKADVAASIAMARELDQTLRFDLAAHLETLEAQLAALAQKDVDVQKVLDDYKARIEAVEAADYQKQISALEEQLKALSEGQVDVDAVKAEVEAIVNELVEEITGRVATLENRLQSVSFVPEYINGTTAVLFEENEDNYGYVHMSFEVAPKAYATKLTTENTKLVGVALKSVEVEQYDVQILNANAVTGIVEVIGYIDVDSDIWKGNNDETVKNAALALRVMAEDAQVTSDYVNVNVLGSKKTAVSINDYVYFGRFVDDEFEAVQKTNNAVTTWEYTKPYTATVAESAVKLFEELQSVVTVPGFFVNLPVEDAAALFNFPEGLTVTTTMGKLGADYYVGPANDFAFDLVEDEDDELDTRAFVVAATADKDSLDVTVSFNEAAINGLEDKTDYIGSNTKAELKSGYFRVNGKRAANFDGLVASYKVTGAERTVNLVLNEGKALDQIVWNAETAETADLKFNIKDVNVAEKNGKTIDARKLIVNDDKTATPVALTLDPKAEYDHTAPTVTLNATSHDEVDVTVDLVAWPAKTTTYKYVYNAEATEPSEEDNASETTVYVEFTLDVTVNVDGRVTVDEPIVASPATGVEVVLTHNGVYQPSPASPATAVLTNVDDMLLEIFGELYESEEKALEAIQAKLVNLPVDIYVVEDGEVPATATITGAATYSYGYNEETEVETSQISIPYNTEVFGKLSEKVVRFQFVVNLLGVDVTVIADSQKIAKWEAGSFATAKVVNGRLLPEFYGQQVFALGSMPGTVKSDDGKTVLGTYNYDVPSALGTYDYRKTEKFKFGDYVGFDIHDDDNNVYYVVWQVKQQLGVTHTGSGTTADPHVINSDIPEISIASTNFIVEPGATANAPTSVVNTAFDANTYPIKGWSQPYKLSDNTDLTNFNAITLDWNNSSVASYKVDFKLVTHDGTKFNDVAGSAKTIEFKTKRAISKVTTTDLEIKWNANDFASMEANVATAVEVEDLNNVVINNQGADRTMATFWDGYSVDNDAVKTAGAPYAAIYKTDANVSGSAGIYGQVINLVKFDTDDDATTTTMGYIKAPQGYVAGTDFTFNSTSGAFVFKPRTQPSGDVEFTVYVEVTHGNSYGQTGLKQPVKIKIDVE